RHRPDPAKWLNRAAEMTRGYHAGFSRYESTALPTELRRLRGHLTIHHDRFDRRRRIRTRREGRPMFRSLRILALLALTPMLGGWGAAGGPQNAPGSRPARRARGPAPPGAGHRAHTRGGSRYRGRRWRRCSPAAPMCSSTVAFRTEKPAPTWSTSTIRTRGAW